VPPTPVRSFLFTVRVAVALTLLLPLLWLRLLITRGERTRFLLVRACARRVLQVAGCRVSLTTVSECESGPVMFVANHASLADAAVLLAALPIEIRFVANHVFARYPVLGAAIRASSAHIVDRGSWRSRGECGRTMVTALREGQSLLVFPEGTTSADGRLLPFRNGAFKAAIECGTPVVPIVLRGTRKMFPPASLLLHDVMVHVDVLPPLHPAGGTREAVADLKTRAVEAIASGLTREG
jgi:1-acyl-sn-glycerol-3-phosphate acyltransferase